MVAVYHEPEFGLLFNYENSGHPTRTIRHGISELPTFLVLYANRQVLVIWFFLRYKLHNFCQYFCRGRNG